MFDWLVNTPPTPDKNYKDLLATKYFLLLYQTVKEVLISWKYARKKILNLTLGVNFCIFRHRTVNLLPPSPCLSFFHKLLFFLPDNFLYKRLCDRALLIVLCIWQMPTIISKYQQFASEFFLSR